jgi:hypothetical protein
LQRAAALGCAVLALAVAFFVVRPISTPGPALRDFESYYAAGVAWSQGDDPYSRAIWRTERTIPGVVATRDELLPFVGPPFGLPLWAAFARLDYGSATIVWGFVLALAFASIAFGSLLLGGGRIGPFELVAVPIVAAGFGPLTSGLALGQVAIVACAASILTLLALQRSAFAAAPAALVAALQPNIGIALAGRLGDRRSWIAFALAAAVALGGSAIALGGPAGVVRYAGVLQQHAAAELFIAIQTTTEAIFRAFGASPLFATLAYALIAIAVLVLVGLQFFSKRYGPVERFALACAALPLALPFAHEHDFTIAFFPAILALRRSSDRLWPVAAIGVLLAGVDWLGLAQRPSGLAATFFLTVAAALGLWLLSNARPRALLWPLGVAAGVVALGIAAGTHPLPIWPDALPLGFHAGATASAATVWALEQTASGLGAIDPMWGFLRLLSLIGCAVVWAVASRALAQPAEPTARTAR